MNDFFLQDWNEDKAYILGFTLADGNLYITNKEAKIQYTVKQSDIAVLDFIKDVSGYTGDVYNYNQHGNFDGEDVAILHLRSKQIVYDFMRLGLVEKKTYYNLPVFDIAFEKGYFRDFVRGYFDGDGCVSTYKQKKGRTTDNIRVFFVCKCRGNLESLGRLLKKEIGIIPKIYPLNESFRLQYGGKEVVKLYDYLYNDLNSFTLESKMKVFINWLEYKGMSNTYFAHCKKCGSRFIRNHPGIKVCDSCKI